MLNEIELEKQQPSINLKHPDGVGDSTDEERRYFTCDFLNFKDLFPSWLTYIFKNEL